VKSGEWGVESEERSAKYDERRVGVGKMGHRRYATYDIWQSMTDRDNRVED